MIPLPKKSRSAHRRGAALVIVLALLVIILGLAVTFLSRTTLERGASASYAASATTRQMADIAVNLVQGQIHNATAQGTSVAWASQPGMIRNFDPTGNPVKAYKLYSADALILDNPTAADLAADEPIPAWAASPAVWTDLNAPVAANGVTNYPILDPGALGSIEGFSLIAPPTTGTANPAPMPVKWLYVLQDGTIVSPGGTGTTATVAGASKANPIVGRIAFWTDDETCKLNINTASEGTFWDVPKVNTTQDRLLARFQPAQKEFQRYPGHPAMTSLAPVFFATSATTTPPLTSAQKEAIYAITPKVVGGGSNAGTAVAAGALTPDSTRLYASVDELIFSASRASQPADAGLTKAKLEQARFFLTASSRAPEVTLFNTPRVAIWPISSNPASSHRTVFDSLIAFAATINNQPYYFQRANSQSATQDYAAIPRNQLLYGYLKNLTDRDFPGFGGNSFAAKYQADRDQIVTEIFDYIRSTNTSDSGLALATSRYGAKIGSPPMNQDEGENQVVPIRIGATQGFGRFPVPTELGIQFIATADFATPTSNVAGNKTLGGTLLTANQRRIEALFFFEMFIPGLGWPPLYPSYSVRMRGLEQFQVATGTLTSSLGFPSDATVMNGNSPGSLADTRSWGGVISPNSQISYDSRAVRSSETPMPSDTGGWDRQKYRLVSLPVTVDVTAGTMQFTGGDLIVEVYPRNSASYPGYTAPPVYEFKINIPNGTFPIPGLDADDRYWTYSMAGNGLTTTGRFKVGIYSDGPGTTFRAGDVVRTVVPKSADYRLLAASPSLDSSAAIPEANRAYVKHPKYDDSTVLLAHSLVEGKGNTLNGATLDRLVSGVSYSWDKNPDVPLSDANAADGDWDNGISIAVDGAYINKPDEGNSKGLDLGQTPYFDEGHTWQSGGTALFSPNRQVPSAGMFGSLSSGVKAGVSFRTLLFRPQSSHFGSTGAPDHLWTDLFWMPVVEPYAISEPFSTAGKINMNYAIAPFSYIRRATGMVGLLRSETILAIPKTSGNTYKTQDSISNASLRSPIDIPQTLSQFDTIFASGNLFRSSSQICELHLVPQGTTLAAMSTFWTTNGLTGDNSRERPYANLLGRLTTKSNSYVVHYRVQSLKQSPQNTGGTWDETRDKVSGEYRGSTTIERYINPNDTRIPDYPSDLTKIDTDPISNFYKWRVINTRQFAP